MEVEDESGAREAMCVRRNRLEKPLGTREQQGYKVQFLGMEIRLVECLPGVDKALFDPWHTV